jgi:hypothetical protein
MVPEILHSQQNAEAEKMNTHPPSTAKVKNEWSHISDLSMVWTGTALRHFYIHL